MTMRRSCPWLLTLALAAPVAAQTAPDEPARDTAWATAQADRDTARRDRDAQRADGQRDRENAEYERGYDALGDERWDRAISAFTRVVDMNGSRADAALYWKAYAQNRQGQRADALATIAALSKTHPASRYVKEAKALEVEVRGQTGAPVRPETQGDDDLKVLAIQSMQGVDPEQAVPLLEKVLVGGGSPNVKNKALFVLAQMNHPRAQETLKTFAKGGSTPELQRRAIQYLALHGDRDSRGILAEIYASSADVDVKRQILRSFMISGEKARLLTAAQTEPNPELRVEAVRQLGVMGAHDELWQLYQKETAVEVKRQVISAIQISGNSARMIDLAKSEKEPELRRTAVRNLGIMGAANTGAALAEIYSTDKDEAIRRSSLNGLFIQGNATQLVALARKESDATMKKEIVQKLSLMGDNKVARDYMLELLK